MGSDVWIDVPTDDLGWDGDAKFEQLRRLADEIGEPLGLPMPLRRHALDTHLGYEHSDFVASVRRILRGKPETGGVMPGAEIHHTCSGTDIWYPINDWVDEKRRRKVYLVQLIEEAPGDEYGRPGAIVIRFKFRAKVEPLADETTTRLAMTFETISASDAWDVEAEMEAQRKLRGLIDDYAYRRYLLTGAFPEQSKRSGIVYLFRRLRPTIACSPEDKSNPEGGMRPLAALCLHPIGYYRGTWAGAMCPTDDVIAHLSLMRGDEHFFWRKANHHSLAAAEAGV